MLTRGFCRACSKALSTGSKKLMPLTVLLLDGARLGEPVEGTDAGGEVVERGEMRQIAAVAAEQDLTQVDQAVDGLLDGGEDAGSAAPADVPPCGGA